MSPHLLILEEKKHALKTKNNQETRKAKLKFLHFRFRHQINNPHNTGVSGVIPLLGFFQAFFNPVIPW